MPLIAVATEATAIDSVLSAVSKVVEFSGTILTTMLNNPIYLFIFAAGFVGIGVSIVRKLKGAARS